MTTTNKKLNIPANNTYVNNWDIPMNTNFTGIDYALGGACYISVSGRSGTYTLGGTYSSTFPYPPENIGTLASPTTTGSPSYIPSNIIFMGGYATSLRFNVPAGIKGQWTVFNNAIATGEETITFGVTGGSGVIVPVGQRVYVVSDGVDVSYAQEPTITIGSTDCTLGGTYDTINDLTLVDAAVTGRLPIDGNLLVNSPVYGWGGDYLVDGGFVDIALSGSIVNSNGQTHIANNAYYDGTNWKRKIAGYSGLIGLGSDGSMTLYFGGTGAVNSIITWTPAIQASATGSVSMPVDSSTSTAPAGTNSTRIATTAFVQSAVTSTAMFTASTSYGSGERAAGVVYTNTRSTPLCVLYSTNLSDLSGHYFVMKVNGNEAQIQGHSDGESWVNGAIIVPPGQTYQITREYNDTNWGSSRWVEVYTP